MLHQCLPMRMEPNVDSTILTAPASLSTSYPSICKCTGSDPRQQRRARRTRQARSECPLNYSTLLLGRQILRRHVLGALVITVQRMKLSRETGLNGLCLLVTSRHIFPITRAQHRALRRKVLRNLIRQNLALRFKHGNTTTRSRTNATTQLVFLSVHVS